MQTDKATSLRFVVDASVAVKWFSEEPGGNLAKYLVNKVAQKMAILYAPELLTYEVGNALWKGKGLRRDLITKALNDLLGMDIRYAPLDRTLIESSTLFMTLYDLTFYDAVYAGLAFLLKAPLLTASPKHHGRVKEIKVLGLDKL